MIAVSVDLDIIANTCVRAIAAVTSSRSHSNEGARPDLPQHLIDESLSPHRGTKMETKEVIDQMAEILLAGSETASGTIACFYMEILENPDVKSKVISSLPVLTPNDHIITSKTVTTEPKYEYLEACIKEVL
ncbi:hypothetical protein N7539_004679 [Penicillium diatomitis]|uniref:Uncharacterized protein n=1 Tax=Penicillium diatomitis TaxID=2819901 RepID=A0A9W9XE95_9EURO|nr:uncharacterized protein N7539_004679 [Penicillium diatomitis]KAJ5489789.1 hypothetical protein N7539_004679 [Penicillium diatomitis]